LRRERVKEYPESKPVTPKVYAAGVFGVAEKMYDGSRSAEDATASERACREFLVGIIANHEPLQWKGWNALVAIARKSCTSQKRRVYDIAVDMFMAWLTGKKDVNMRYWSRVIHNKWVDEIRKSLSALRRMAEDLGAQPGVNRRNGDVMDTVMDPEELFDLWKTNPLELYLRWKLGPTTRKAPKTGKDRKTRKDRGKPRWYKMHGTES
jgi:hypothetical protein